MYLALSVSLGAVVFAAFLFKALFRYVGPDMVRTDYRPCAGGWYEAQFQQCGAGLITVPQQPVNTYSNLAYLATGLFPGILWGTPASYVFAFTMVYLCIGSTLYHATSTHWSGMLDVTAIYVVFSSLVVYVVSVLLNLPQWLTPGLMFIIPGGIAFALSQRYHDNMRLIIGLFLGSLYLLLLLHMWKQKNWNPWPRTLTSFTLFGFAFLCWSMDKARTFPFPRWGHGLWHILTAIAIGCLFMAIHLADS